MSWWRHVLSLKYSIWTFLSFHFSSVIDYGWVGWSSITLSASVTQNIHQNLNYHVSVDRENHDGRIKIRTKFLRASHKHVDSSTNTRQTLPTLWLKHEQSAVQDPMVRWRIRSKTPVKRKHQPIPLPWPHSLQETLQFTDCHHIFLCFPFNHYSTTTFTIASEASLCA